MMFCTPRAPGPQACSQNTASEVSKPRTMTPPGEVCPAMVTSPASTCAEVSMTPLTLKST